MNPYSIPPLLCLLLMPILGIYIYSKNSRSEVHRFFLVVIAGITFWAFTEFNVRQSESYAHALFWIRLRAFRIFLAPFLIHFILIYINRWREYHKLRALFLLYSTALFLVCSDLFFGALTGFPVKEAWGWAVGKPLWPFVLIFYLAWNFAAFIFMAKESATFIKSANGEERKSFYLLLWGLVICMAIGVVSGTVYTLLRPDFPEFSILFAFLFAVYLSYIIWKYNLFISPADTAENIIDLMGDGLIISGVRNRITRVNRALLELTGYTETELIGTDISLLIDDESKRCRCNKKEILLPHDAKLMSKSGQVISVLLCQTVVVNKGNIPAATITIVKDLTLWHKAQQELVHAEKLESFELIIRGITHDFNNLLTSICGNLAITEQSGKLDSVLQPNVGAARKAALVAANLNKRLSTYAKEDVLNTELCSIADIIEEAAELTLKGTSITFDHRFENNLWSVNVDPNRMIQLFVNLFINARHAMKSTGTITVRCFNSKGDAGSDVLKITVHDDGAGIPATIIDHVFDPFFTTKAEGSGLGLLMAKNAVIAHQGTIRVESKPGEGTTFFILLPKAMLLTDAAMPMVEFDRKTSPKKILVMDDDNSVRLAFSVLLSQMGHTVVLTKNGAEAINVFSDEQQKGSPFDCTILDLTVVSGIGGDDAIQQILTIDPTAKVVLASGHESHPVIQDYQAYGFHSLLKKPFTLADVKCSMADVFEACCSN